MSNPVYEKADLTFNMFIKNREQLKLMIDNDRLNVSKETFFIVKHLFAGTLNDLDFELYSDEINVIYRIYLNVLENNKPIHGDFYPELRQRYFDLLDSTPIENSSEPLTKSHLAWMLVKLSDDMSETKKHRWLGYIQGCMTFLGAITVNEEREITRTIFNGK